ncbi:hypothetical protein D4Q76_00605 [archaeon]|nr:MAG: hypothetical protein D4Q76_00605 [archaeon]
MQHEESEKERKERLDKLVFYLTTPQEDKKNNKERYDKRRILHLFEGESLTPYEVSFMLSGCCGVIDTNFCRKYMNELVIDRLLINDTKNGEAAYKRNF